MSVQIEHALVRAGRALRHARSIATQFSKLGVINLPPAQNRLVDRANLSSTAFLYLASEVERAQLVEMVELIAGLFATGGLRMQSGTTASLVHQFWRNRRDRPTLAERQASYARLFGAPSDVSFAINNAVNTQFEELMINFADALIAFHEEKNANVRKSVQLQTANRMLLDNILPRSGGVALFLAESIRELIQDAIEIINSREVQAALAVNSAWEVVSRTSQRYRQKPVRITPHVDRGKSGFELISSLSNAHLNSQPTREIAVHAYRWLQASMVLYGGTSPLRLAVG